MDISRQFISNPVRVWLTILLLGVGGIIALLNIGRLEDPAFTIKTAVVITHYPGASAQQVEEEVTLPLENALQQLPYLDNVRLHLLQRPVADHGQYSLALPLKCTAANLG